MRSFEVQNCKDDVDKTNHGQERTISWRNCWIQLSHLGGNLVMRVGSLVSLFDTSISISGSYDSLEFESRNDSLTDCRYTLLDIYTIVSRSTFCVWFPRRLGLFEHIVTHSLDIAVP